MKKTSLHFQRLFGTLAICLLMMTPLLISCGSSGDGVNGGSIGSDSSSGDDLQFSGSDVTQQIIAAHGVDDSLSKLPDPTVEYSYVRVRRDLRKCASPLCGGFFVSALNKRALRCIDGSLSESCYVAEIDWSKTSLSSSQIIELENAPAGQVIVFGQIRPFVDLHNVKRDTLGVLTAGRVWLAATDAEPKGYFFRVEDLGIRCFTTPCFSMQAFFLNWHKSVTISALDLKGVGASDDQVMEAWKAMADGRLLVTGTLKTTTERQGRALTASKFYLPIDPIECFTDEDCDADSWCRPDSEGVGTCVPFAGPGERCEGFVLPETRERCAEGLICVPVESTGDIPGICASCELDGKPYQAGESFPDPDGCNVCTCMEDGTIACTDRTCPDGCKYDGRIYEPGDSFPAGDGCNTCTCLDNGTVACTKIACPGPCEYNGEIYKPGDTFPAVDGCNKCQCLDDGTVACTEIACPDSCEYNGEIYKPGDTFPGDDGCNKCQCLDNGTVVCTLMACPQPCEYNGVLMEPGDTLRFDDGCNICECLADGRVICTMKPCVLQHY